jgi:hypothetical protein
MDTDDRGIFPGEVIRGNPHKSVASGPLWYDFVCGAAIALPLPRNPVHRPRVDFGGIAR